MDAKSSAGVPLSSPAAAQRCAKGAGLDSGTPAAAQSAMPSIALPATAPTAEHFPPNAAALATPHLQSRISTSLTDVTVAHNGCDIGAHFGRAAIILVARIGWIEQIIIADFGAIQNSKPRGRVKSGIVFVHRAFVPQPRDEIHRDAEIKGDVPDAVINRGSRRELAQSAQPRCHRQGEAVPPLVSRREE